MRLKNEVMVGVMVLAAIVLLVVAAFWLSGEPWGEEQQEVVAAFREVGELTEGNPVKFRGVTVGRVSEIALIPEGTGVLVTMSVSPGIVFPADVAVVLAPASLFGDWQAQLVSMQTYPDLEFITVPLPDVLPGASLPDISQLTAVAARIAGDIEVLTERIDVAFTEETAIKIRKTVDNVQEITEQLSGFVGQQTETYRDVSQNVLSATANIEDATGAVQRAAGQVEQAVTEGDIQQILSNAREASENLRDLSVQLETAAAGTPGLVARADQTLVSVGAVADEAAATVRDLRPQLEQIGPTMIEAQRAMGTLQRVLAGIESGDGTMGRLLSDPALYEETQSAIATLQRILADLQKNPGKYIGQVQIKVF